jgi:hypothetical protein
MARSTLAHTVGEGVLAAELVALEVGEVVVGYRVEIPVPGCSPSREAPGLKTDNHPRKTRQNHTFGRIKPPFGGGRSGPFELQ